MSNAFKCENCGANLQAEITEDKKEEKFISCPYCGTHCLNPYYKEGLDVNEVVNVIKEQTNNVVKTINKNSDEYVKEKRPKLSIPLLIILLLFNVFPGVIYLLVVLYLQARYDKNH